MVERREKKKNTRGPMGFKPVTSWSAVKYLAFDTLNFKKPFSSSILNAIIFGIDEQCNLKFETALFTRSKSYIIFLFRWGSLFLKRESEK